MLVKSVFKYFLIAASMLLFSIAMVQAQTSLGLGAGDPTGSSTSTGIIGTINQYQQEFYRSLSGALKGMRDDPSKLWLLIALSFAYGVFHAAGPGHGKAIISSYMIANEIALKRGVILSFLAGLMQGVMAIVVVGAVYFLLRGTGISMGSATRTLELASYILIIAFGAWLLWRKLRGFLKSRQSSSHHHTHHTHHAHSHDHGHSHSHHHNHDHHHHDGEVCSTCGHAHMPEPTALDGELSLKQAWSAVVAVGIRPCSGSIFVLSFAILNGLYLGGILSVFAISIGTAITVSILATLAVTAKNIAVRYTDGTVAGANIGSMIEILGASLILILGTLLLSAALS